MNIVRDVGEDVCRGWVYLLCIWFEVEGDLLEWLFVELVLCFGVRCVMLCLFDRVDVLYVRVDLGVSYFLVDCRVVICVVRLVYFDIGCLVRVWGGDGVMVRVSMSGVCKVWFLLCAFVVFFVFCRLFDVFFFDVVRFLVSVVSELFRCLVFFVLRSGA